MSDRKKPFKITFDYLDGLVTKATDASLGGATTFAVPTTEMMSLAMWAWQRAKIEAMTKNEILVCHVPKIDDDDEASIIVWLLTDKGPIPFMCIDAAIAYVRGGGEDKTVKPHLAAFMEMAVDGDVTWDHRPALIPIVVEEGDSPEDALRRAYGDDVINTVRLVGELHLDDDDEE